MYLVFLFPFSLSLVPLLPFPFQTLSLQYCRLRDVHDKTTTPRFRDEYITPVSSTASFPLQPLPPPPLTLSVPCPNRSNHKPLDHLHSLRYNKFVATTITTNIHNNIINNTDLTICRHCPLQSGSYHADHNTDLDKMVRPTIPRDLDTAVILVTPCPLSPLPMPASPTHPGLPVQSMPVSTTTAALHCTASRARDQKSSDSSHL